MQNKKIEALLVHVENHNVFRKSCKNIEIEDFQLRGIFLNLMILNSLPEIFKQYRRNSLKISARDYLFHFRVQSPWTQKNK